MAIQRELWSVLEEARGNWLKLAEREAQLISELTANLSTCKSPPEMAKVYQDWASAMLNLMAQESQRVFASGQKFTTTAVTMLTNGLQRDRT